MLCVFNDGLLVLVLERVHFVRCHQLAKERAEMVVRDAAREGTRFDGLPQAPLEVLGLPVHADDAALRAEEGLVGRARDNLCALFKRLLEMIADEAEHMRHVVHDGGLDALLVDKLADLGDRLFIKDHGLAEDDELGLVLREQNLRLFYVDLVGVILADREVDDHLFFGDGVDGDVVVERAHGLRRQVAAADDVVVHDPAEPLRGALAVDAVFKVHHRGEDCRVRHLAGRDAGFYLRRAEELFHFLNEHGLDRRDEARALIVENLCVVERLLLFVLGVAVAGVGRGEHPDGSGLRVLRRDEVDALGLAPQMVLLGGGDEVLHLLGIGIGAGSSRFDLHIGKDRADIGRGVLTDMVADDLCRLTAAADVDFNVEVLADAAVHVSKADGALAGLVGEDALKTLALGLVIRDHGARGDIADLLALSPCVLAVDREALAQNALALEIDGLDAVRQVLDRGVVAVHDLLERLKLLLERFAADEIALGLVEGNGELRQRHGVDLNLAAHFALAHFVAVERERGFHTRGVARAERGRLCAKLDETVPEVPGVFRVAVQLIADGLASIAGLCDADGLTLHGEAVQRVLDILGRQLTAAGERHEDLLGFRALHGDGCILVRDVRELDVEVLRFVHQVCPVLVDVAGVDDEEVLAFFKAVQVRVVDGVAVRVRDDAVLRLVEVERKHVAGKHMLQERHLIGAFDVDPSHVGYVEDAAVTAAVEMLRDDAFGILDGHIPAAEVDHGRACVKMCLVQNRPFQFAHSFLLIM